jgi:2-polyprenyl-3-methyl-5-hydroxy-6-metoxy-1,4-benzoquinol methylase
MLQRLFKSIGGRRETAASHEQQAVRAPAEGTAPWRTSQLPLAEIKRLVASRHWHHDYEIVPGVFTPGGSQIDPQKTVSAYGVPDDLTGMTALDIGTFDGPYAFELERRGATVTAIDIQPPDVTAFNVAHQILGSQVNYIQGSIYDLPQLTDQRFDIVFFPGVYYHLKHPIMAFEQIAKVMIDGGKLHFIGECLISYAERLDGSRETGGWIKQAADSDVPLCLSYPGLYKGVSNWFVPNLACIKSWLTAAGFTLERHGFYHAPAETPYPHQRLHGTAVKANIAVKEHPIVAEDQELAAWRRAPTP